jgi:hypothetical protein
MAGPVRASSRSTKWARRRSRACCRGGSRRAAGCGRRGRRARSRRAPPRGPGPGRCGGGLQLRRPPCRRPAGRRRVRRRSCSMSRVGRCAKGWRRRCCAAGQQPAEAAQHLRVVQLRRAAAAARAQREAKCRCRCRVAPWRPAAAPPAPRVRERLGEGVLLEDLRVAPAPGAVELDDHRGGVVEADLVDPVLVAVQRQQPAVHRQPDGFDGVEHDDPGPSSRRRASGRFRRGLSWSFGHWRACGRAPAGAIPGPIARRARR